MFDKKKYMNKYRKKNKEKIKIQKREYDKKYREKNKEMLKKKKKEYYQRPAVLRKRREDNQIPEVRKAKKDYMKKYCKGKRERINYLHDKYIKKNPKKIKARSLAIYKVPLKLSCEICGDNKRLERHHWNYNKPLMVNTLCGFCHDVQHLKNIRREVKESG